MSAFFKINEDALSHELIDGEVVIIQFDTGNYYSLAGTAALLWQRLTSPASSSDLLALFRDAPPEAETEITTFLNDLTQETLLQTVAADSTASSADPVSEVAYVKPELNKYTDMQQLLLADPLHEVQEAGWPHTKPPEA